MSAKGPNSYADLHWGQVGERSSERLRAADPREGRAVLLGDLVSLVYRTRKGLDRELTDYEHAFKTPRPRLCVTRSGLLLIAGGTYTVEERGIVG